MKILFVSHEASRTGAPILLLNLARWLKVHKGIECLFILHKGGDLYDQFKKTGETYLWNLPLQKQSWIRKVADKFRNSDLRKRHQQKIIHRVMRFHPDLIYYNSIGSCELVPILQDRMDQAIALMHVHELETIIRQLNPH